MNFDFLARPARQVVLAAQRLARARGEEAVELEHLLHALCDDPDAAELMRAASGRPSAPDELRARLREALAPLPKVAEPKVYLSERVLRLFDVAQVDARERGRAEVRPVDLLRAIPLETQATATALLRAAGLTLPVLDGAGEAASARGAPGVSAPGARAGAALDGSATAGPGQDDGRFPALARAARELTALARAGRLAPVVGRHDELRRILQILARSTKNSPLLVGEPGVGKTALVEGLAQRIADGDVPASLRHRRVFALDLGALLADARGRGELEERLRAVLAEARDAAGEVLLFVDELHGLASAGRGGDAPGAAALLKSALARGELAVIGATTPEAYRTHLEKDPALERRFAPLFVTEPTAAACLDMLRGARARFEEAHGLGIEEGALAAAVKLAARYVRGRALPDKAFDLLDEAAARLRLELESHPEELDRRLRERRALELELAGLDARPGGDPGRATVLRAELARVTAEVEPLRARWRAELDGITRLHQLEARKLELARAADAALRRGALEEAARVRHGELPALTAELDAARAALRAAQGAEPLLEESVQDVHVARVVEDWTGVPVGRMLEGEREKLLAVQERLRARVIGQDEAVRLVGHAVQRARAGLSDPGRPIGSFLFLGPTGVGKTELAKALAEFLFDDVHALVRLDMSEFMEKQSAQRLTGAPPGYVGYEEGGQLTEAVRRRPYAVVLFDEVEKAHPDVFNVLLALLDDGRLTDSAGRTVGFHNTVLILTSNLGSQAIFEHAGDREAMRAAVRRAVAEHFRPEFVNRIDELVVFESLGPPEIARIVELQLARLRALLAEQGLALEIEPDALAQLCEESYDPAFGARPVGRTLQRRLRDPLAELILAGRAPAGSIVVVRGRGSALDLGVRAPGAPPR